MKAVPVMTSIMRLRVRRAGPSGSLLAAVLLLGACTANPPAPVACLFNVVLPKNGSPCTYESHDLML